ncbi:MAG TPA: SpoIIE family protein phosphatase [Casimicrobiaceae bacterium]|nr:SpoIIE family protein phosphatase [Casimicrobiaceae bacterium]
MTQLANSAAALLVVDDNEDNREILAARLAQLGYTNVTLATGGREALELIERRPCDLVLLDVMMPAVGGIQVLEALRERKRLAQLPVIMVSAAAEQESVVRCIELGAEDYLQKPVNVTMLRARVAATLEKRALREEARTRMVELGHDLAAARELQRGMVPLDHEREDSPVTLHFLLEPARELGGDLCDFLFTDGDTLWVGLGDVSGKGVAAAIFMARTWSVLRSIAGRAPRASIEDSDPGRVLMATNRELCKANEKSMFCSVFLARLHLATGVLEYANAGHLPPCLLRASGAIETLDVRPALPVGGMPETIYEARTTTLAPGDGLFVYSDGVTEATNAAREQYGDGRLVDDLRLLVNARGRDVLDRIREKVREHCAGAPQADDLTALVMRWQPG